MGDLLHAATVGGVGAAYMWYMYPFATMDVFGSSYSLAAASFAALAVSAIVSQSLHDYVLPVIDSDKRWVDPSSAITNTGISALSMYAVSMVGDKSLSSDFNIGKFFLFAIGSEALGDYAYRNFVGPMMGY